MCRVIGGDHRVSRGQTPFGTIFIHGQAMAGADMALQHLLGSAAFQAVDGCRSHRFFHRYGGGKGLQCRRLGRRSPGQRRKSSPNQIGQLADCNFILRDISRDKLCRQPDHDCRPFSQTHDVLLHASPVFPNVRDELARRRRFPKSAVSISVCPVHAIIGQDVRMTSVRRASTKPPMNHIPFVL